MFAVVAAAGACGPSKAPAPAFKKPNNELILDEFERRKPDGETAVRFTGDGGFRMAKTRADLDREPIAKGAWKLDGDELTFTAESGWCTDAPGEKEGTYKVVLSKIGIRFTKVSDSCERRARLDGQTWWRIK